MAKGREWLLASPFTGNVHAVVLEEARRLLLFGGPDALALLAELDAAEAEAARTGRDSPVASSPDWLVCPPSARHP